ncbi:hypothetical protein ACIQOU_19780 [Streptomyces sp. NPDC091279]|uniref:hypothetical protein n=1 Tax=unclassified Streptomyces TaxID=2593676 RepID=UPI00380FC76B
MTADQIAPDTTRPRRRASRLAVAASTVLVAAATVLVTSPQASAATTWTTTGVGGGQARAVFIVSNSAGGVCSTANNRFSDPAGSTIRTTVFDSDVNCSAGAGQTCTGVVPSESSAVRVFDIRTCRWVG